MCTAGLHCFRALPSPLSAFANSLPSDLLSAGDNVHRNATRSFLRHPMLRSKMTENRIGMQAWLFVC